MIPIPNGVRVWIASGHTDMRKGMPGLVLLVQEALGRDPFAGDVYVFRGRSGSLIKAVWHDGIGLSLYARRLDRGRFIWPRTVGGVVALTAGQMSYLLEGIDWRNPQLTWRPQAGACQIFCARGRFSSCDDEPVAEDDGELGFGLEPFARRSFPLLRGVIENEV